MGTLAALYERGRPNSIGFLRFALAAMVVLSHSFRLGGFGAEPLTRSSGETLGTLAVDCFFVLSGFLITRSYATSSSLPRYLWHRVLRIFPAYWVCLFVTAFAIGPVLRWASTQPHALGDYFAQPPTALNYVTSNSLLRIVQPGIDGLLRRVPLPTHINGALWSLEHEFRCYLAVALLGALGLWTARRTAGRLVALASFLSLLAVVNVPGLLDRAALHYNDALTVRLALWFAAGTVGYLFAERIPMRWWLFLPALAGVVMALVTKHQHLVGPVALSYTLFYLALRLPLSWWDRRGDFSYGLYIYAFPIQQSLVALGWARHGVGVYFITAMLIATALAMLSWYGVERPLLRLRHLGTRTPVR